MSTENNLYAWKGTYADSASMHGTHVVPQSMRLFSRKGGEV